MAMQDLRSRNDEVRTRAAHAFQEKIYNDSRINVVGPAFGKVDNTILQRLIQLTNSPDVGDKLAGITAIESMLGMLPPSDLSLAVKLASNVLKAIPCPDPLVMGLAAKVYARLAAAGGVLMIGLVNIQLKMTIEWLQGERIEFKRWGAVLLLRELSKTVPLLMYEHIPDLLDNLWTAMRDPKVAIREVAAGALSGCLKIAFERDGSLRSEWYGMVYEQAAKGFRSNSLEAIHGSLLGYQELFLRAGMFMHSRYKEVCDQILSYRDHRDSLVRQAVISLMPTMATYDEKEFTSSYLHKCMIHLLSQLKRERDRTYSFKAIGNIALAVGSNMAAYLDAVLDSCKEGLQARGRKNAPSEGPIFECISMLALSLGQVLTKHMHELLDLMFAYGLSEPLVLALKNLAHYIPPLKSTIQERLLDLLSSLLAGQPFRHPGAPISVNSAVRLNGPMSSIPSAVHEQKDPVMVTLALSTLGDFDFSGHILSEFIADCIVTYLEDDSPEVRLAAASTTSKLFAEDPIVHQISAHAVRLVGEVLEKLLTVAIADPDVAIRKSTLLSLDPRFDRHLAQAENVRSLVIAMNDEDFEIRELAIQMIGRLATLNPAYVMPSLRKTLIQLLTELEYSTKDRNKEQAAILISHLVAASQRITKPYVLPMLKVLLPKAKDRNPDVASAIMTAMGDLARVGGEDLTSRLKDYMDLIIDTLHDQAAPGKREAALRTLGQLASGSGYVIEPYVQYPALLSTLISILQTEPSASGKRETVRAIGMLGALDPYKHTAIERDLTDNNPEPFGFADSNYSYVYGLSNDASYYPTAALRALLSILRDPSLNSHHTAVIEAIMYIFRSLRLKCVMFLPQVIPAFLGAMRSCPPNLQEYYIQNLGHLIATVKQHIRKHLPPILALISDFWTSGVTLQVIIVDLIESIATALEGEFKIYLPILLPLLLQAFEGDSTDRKTQTQLRILRAFGTFGANLEEYLHLTVPIIVKTFERLDLPLAVRKAAITTLNVLCRKMNFTDHASRVVHPLVRILNSAPNELKMAAVDTLCTLMTQIGPEFAIFIPLINKTLLRNRIQHAKYESLVSKLLRGESLPQDQGKLMRGEDETSIAADAGVGKLPVNQRNLMSAWETTERAKADDWREWLKRLAVQLLKSSPSHSLRACANLAEVYHPLARELFNPAFVSCWQELYDNYQDQLVRAIMTALASPSVPTEVMQTLLNLAEFMEHDDKMLPIPAQMLGTYANRCHAYAKALHYKETEFFSSNSYEIIEDLIRINNHLQQPDTAMGILTYAQQHFDVRNLSEDWYEKLEKWDDALVAYESRQAADPNNFDLTLGRMRCLHALGEWESLSQLAADYWAHASIDLKRKIAPLGAASAWGQQNWDSMEEFVSVLKHDSADRAWFRSILNIHKGEFGKAQSHINKARDLLVTELTTLVGESYNRAYNQIVRVQMLSELEEIIQYKEASNLNLPDHRERRQVIQKTWMKRLRGCQRDVEVWQRILKVRALVMTPRENVDMWIKFANLCRKSGRMGLAEKTINSLLGYEADNGPPHVIYANLKYMWATGEREDTLVRLQEFTRKLKDDLEQQSLQSELQPTYTRLLARCNYKQGEWAMALRDDWGSDIVSDALQSYHYATMLDPKWYKAWHAWALANTEVVSHYMKTRSESDTNPIPQAMYTDFLVPAVRGFFHSIALSPGKSLQDTLRLLTLWFNYGHQGDVSAAMQEGLGSVSIDTWLEVIPQLIARLYAPATNVRRLVQQMLADIGRAHPQALVYALTVASKYPSPPRRRAALSILDKMREHSATLVEQAVLVASELNRVAVLWQELWHDCLEEASRLYYAEKNTNAMFGVLEPMHALMDSGPETLREISFVATYGRDLSDARIYCQRYRQNGEIGDLNQAWDLYYEIFKRIAKSLSGLTQVELQYSSPKLLAAKNLELAVPGTYHIGKPVNHIIEFNPDFEVMTSKQRPRKLKIRGSDGNDHHFLLKGHEDLRQDERVMQLLGLVNTLLAKDPETFKRHLIAQTYPAIPLSTQSGLLSWLSNTDTMHFLIKEYRESRKIYLNLEHRLMSQMSPPPPLSNSYEHLTLMQKVEVFQYALDNTMGQDLYRILWLKSKASEAWLDRRTNYTRSLAVMSMVGHILGLGDRHPSNLILSRDNGMVIHVDFGDCFEVAMVRDKYPEKVPFRLTRMLQNAMEVSRIEGTFRITCQHTMRVLRENKESVIAVLEAFSRDPLINWRLVAGGKTIETETRPGRGEAVASRSGGEAIDQYQRRPRADESNQFDEEANEILNQKALQVVDRVVQKLTGRDFKPDVVLTVPEQVDRLIQQATNIEHWATSFLGWCSFW